MKTGALVYDFQRDILGMLNRVPHGLKMSFNVKSLFTF